MIAGIDSGRKLEVNFFKEMGEGLADDVSLLLEGKAIVLEVRGLDCIAEWEVSET